MSNTGHDDTATKRDSGRRGVSVWGVVHDVWLAVIELAKSAVAADATPMRQATAIVLIILILGIFACVAFLAFGKPENDIHAAIIFVVVVVGGFALACVFVWRSTRNTTQTLASWDRTIVQMPLSSEAAGPLGGLLEEVRNEAGKFLKSRHNDEIDLTLIRANIFLPDYHDNEDGKAPYVLRCPAELTRAMGSDMGKKLRLLPGEGLSGAVFLNGERRVTIDRMDGLWTGENKLLVDEDLSWIVSQPLKNTGQITLGVLNVDGRKFAVDVSRDLDALAVHIAPHVAKVAEALARAPMCTLRVSIEPLEVGPVV